MSKNAIKMAGMFVLGAATGAAATAVYFVKMAKKEFEKSEEEVEKIRNMYRDKMNGLDKYDSKSVDAGTIANGKVKDKPETGIQNGPVKPVDYSSMYGPESSQVSVSSVKDIEMISEDDFNTKDDYTEAYYLLCSDGTLLNENNEIVADVRNTVGFEAVRLLRSDDENDVVYVRNNRLKMDFEIDRILDTYEERTG